MSDVLDGPAIVWCEGHFATPEGKTAHGLVRFTRRYQVLSVIDSTLAGQDAREFLDGEPGGIPIVASLEEALAEARARGLQPTHFVVGLAPDGGRLPDHGRDTAREAMRAGLHVDSGLHDFLSEDPELIEVSEKSGVKIRDIRMPPHRRHLHHFSGRIEEVGSVKVALLGTDSAVGKRTTAWILVHALEAAGHSVEMVGTGQTGWLQGARYSLVLDSLVNDFVAGELEHAVVSAWDERRPECVVIEGQGSLMNPAYPGGLEILAACRPDVVFLQHAPTRLEYDGFPGYPIQPIEQQIAALEAVSGRKVGGITVNHEGLRSVAEIDAACEALRVRTGLPVCDPLIHGAGALIEVLAPLLEARRG
ncbi:MAG: DUF1611 domain-containing protein [Alphaproteobacteria bacterium]|nr:DUF1611 domain-containing protein [Alphaproteobacteria bacterium]MCB9797791.1 DUF1611 domain-containing protein [Alphaproteobacteria bacterium]